MARYERGGRVPKEERLQEIANLLNVNVRISFYFLTFFKCTFACNSSFFISHDIIDKSDSIMKATSFNL